MSKPEELIQTVSRSQADDWLPVDLGGGFDPDEHLYRRVWREDADLAIEWGMREEDDLHFDWVKWADERVASFFLDILWRGQIVFRERLLLVDGGRCYLPFPGLAFGPEETREEGGARMVLGEVAPESRLARARLLDEFVHGHLGQGGQSNFDLYWDESGLLSEPDQGASD